jgi:hypothetical protein
MYACGSSRLLGGALDVLDLTGRRIELPVAVEATG